MPEQPPPHPPMRTRQVGDGSLVCEALMILILRSPSDTLTIPRAERVELARILRKGGGLVISVDPDGNLYLKLAGDESLGLIDEYAHALRSGQLPATLAEFLGHPSPGETP